MAAAATSALANEVVQPSAKESPVVKIRTMPKKEDVDIKECILNEIRRLKKARKRANSQTVVERLVGRIGLPGSIVSIKVNELIHCGKILAGKNRGKESLKLHEEVNEGDSDTSSDSESEESEEDSHSSVDLDPTFAGKRYHSKSIEPTTHTPSKHLAHATAMVTLPVSIISHLTKNANLANEMLANERQLVYDLMRENTQLKLRIKDLESATGPIPKQGQKTSKPPLSTATEQSKGSNKNKDPVSPLGENNSEKHENTRQENKKSKVNNRNAKNDPVRNYSKAGKNGRIVNSNEKRNVNSWETKETETRKVFIIGDSQLRKINGETLSRDHHSVNVNAMPGSKIAKLKNANIEDDASVVIVHEGTCNIRKQTNPENLAEEIVSTLRDVKSKLPKAQVAFSSILKRNDDLELNAKVIKTNQLLEEKLLLSGLDFINNDNIRYGNISFDGLHVNEGGVKILASNYSKYIRYC
eukprot:Seg2607.2 transcript_id=Seg2607.2/GoldUCD/mRNA.D3Y31 product="hypothetical protein" protein_id=Seg2607.2/GoldUCD/D3Y31